jgi:hypothetical protein
VTGGDLLSALGPVIRALEDLTIPYYIGGSLASSAHGVPRASIDADVIAELGQEQVAPLLARLADAYYVDEERAREAVRTRRSFNLIHLGTMFKVDLFVARGRPFDREALRRARPEALEDAPTPRQFVVASPEDTLLAKLDWFRAGGEVSERQWTDVVGLLRAGWAAVDQEYLGRWAAALGVSDLLQRARGEAKPQVG